MLHKTDGYFVLQKKSNTSLHLIARTVQSMELTPVKVYVTKGYIAFSSFYFFFYPVIWLSTEQYITVAPYSWLYYLVLF